jgi:hypothetical protein
MIEAEQVEAMIRTQPDHVKVADVADLPDAPAGIVHLAAALVVHIGVRQDYPRTARVGPVMIESAPRVHVAVLRPRLLTPGILECRDAVAGCECIDRQPRRVAYLVIDLAEGVEVVRLADFLFAEARELARIASTAGHQGAAATVREW